MSLTRVDTRQIKYIDPDTFNDVQSLNDKLSDIVSVNNYGANGDGVTANDDAFATMESSDRVVFYLPEGTYNLPNTIRLTKSYWGPGQILFKDGYIQKGAPFTDYPARNEDGHRVITSPADLVLCPNGNVTFDGKSIQNIGDPQGAGDAVNLRHINKVILPRITALETALGAVSNEGDEPTTGTLDYQTGTFTPEVVGLSTAGTGIYTRQVGSWVKLGRLVTLRCLVQWTDHTGTGGISIPTNAPAPNANSGFGNVFVSGNPYKTDNPTADLYSGMYGNTITIYRKDGNGLYTTYLHMKDAVSGTAVNLASSTNTIALASSASSVSNYYIDRTIKITAGTGAGLSGVINAYNGATKTATIRSNSTPIPIDNTSQYTITNSGSLECVVSYETTN